MDSVTVDVQPSASVTRSVTLHGGAPAKVKHGAASADVASPARSRSHERAPEPPVGATWKHASCYPHVATCEKAASGAPQASSVGDDRSHAGSNTQRARTTSPSAPGH